MESTKILFLSPYPMGRAPSQRFRYEQYFEILVKNGFTIETNSFVSEQGYQRLYRGGTSFQKFQVLLISFFKRLGLFPKIIGSDYIFIHREATPLGPPVFEWMIAKMLRKKIIFDFDDAIWLTDKPQEGWLEKGLKFRSKVSWICRWSYKVSCGNQFLADYARQFNRNVIINPTTIDTEGLHNPALYQKVNHDGTIIGWTGSSTTLKYLHHIEPVLQALEQRFTTLSFLIIADRNPELNLKNIHFVQWAEKTEIPDLLAIDIGIMPIPDDEWAKGKCGFKALQYMAMGIPALASPVAVNKVIVRHGENGFWCNNDDEWIEKLSLLIEDTQLRKQLGDKAHEFVEQYYSVNSNKENFLQLFT